VNTSSLHKCWLRVRVSATVCVGTYLVEKIDVCVMSHVKVGGIALMPYTHTALPVEWHRMEWNGMSQTSQGGTRSLGLGRIADRARARARATRTVVGRRHGAIFVVVGRYAERVVVVLIEQLPGIDLCRVVEI